VRELVLDLSLKLREHVLPALGARASREHTGEAVGGDITFSIDENAEQFLAEYIVQNAPKVAYYSEDRGLITPANSDSYEWVFIVDPIDGTRPALAGFESACVSVALAKLGDGNPTFSDIELGCVVEIKSGEYFIAQKGHGTESSQTVQLSETTDIERLLWTYGLRGRPARATIEVLANLIDSSSVSGAAFDLGSASYDMTRVITGQLDAYVEPGPIIVEKVPGMREQFEHVGRGHILNNTPYDLAASALCLLESGAVVTDGYGKELDEYRLLGSGPEFQISCIASSNQELHSKLVSEVSSGVNRLLTNSS